MSNPHDSVFKQALGRPERAAAFLRRFLPPELVAALALDRVRLVPGTFVDEALGHRHTDLLFEVPHAGASQEEAPLLVCVLLEHQSSVDRWMARRLMRYIDRIWTRWEGEQPAARALPPVVPLVLYQGPGAWSGPTSLHELVSWGQPPRLEAALAAHVPDFTFLLVELARTPDVALGGDGVALVLKVMKHIRAVHFERHFARFLTTLQAAAEEPGGLQLLVALVHYVLAARDRLDQDQLARMIQSTLGPENGAKVMSVAEQLREEGRRQGREEGRLAEIRLLSRQLVRRFGPLDDEALALLEASTAAERLRWGERLLDAATLREVFGREWGH